MFHFLEICLNQIKALSIPKIINAILPNQALITKKYHKTMLNNCYHILRLENFKNQEQHIAYINKINPCLWIFFDKRDKLTDFNFILNKIILWFMIKNVKILILRGKCIWVKEIKMSIYLRIILNQVRRIFLWRKGRFLGRTNHLRAQKKVIKDKEVKIYVIIKIFCLFRKEMQEKGISQWIEQNQLKL